MPPNLDAWTGAVDAGRDPADRSTGRTARFGMGGAPSRAMRSGVVCQEPTQEEQVRLDTQFLRVANRRLGLMSGVFAGAVGLLVTSSLLLYGPLGWAAPEHLPHFLGAQSALLVLSLSMAALVRYEVFSTRVTLRLGLVYQVAGALVISICAFQGRMLVQPVMVTLSWLAVWILLFPLFVPGPPLRSFGVAFLSATTAPAVFLSWSWLRQEPLPPLPVLADTFLPYYVCAGLAVIPAWLVYDLGEAVSEARARARRLGSYELVERLGRGGMGEVWRADHALLAREAAIKLVRPESLQARNTPAERKETLERFEREAQATAALTSPHTVTLYDYGVTEDGTLYYAMELLDGIDLETLVERFGPVSPARAVHFLRQACESLAEAHAAGLIHRDVKPANLMACRVGGRHDFVKVLDFGLVKRSHGAERGGALETDHDYLVGTPAFLAPELATAREEADGRADLYALGCVAYWLLTGRLVFEQDSAVGIVADHVHLPPPPPSLKSEQHIPPALEEVVLQCLAKDPSRRPGSADELARRLAAVPLTRAWGEEQAKAWWTARLPRRTSAAPSPRPEPDSAAPERSPGASPPAAAEGALPPPPSAFGPSTVRILARERAARARRAAPGDSPLVPRHSGGDHA